MLLPGARARSPSVIRPGQAVRPARSLRTQQAPAPSRVKQGITPGGWPIPATGWSRFGRHINHPPVRVELLRAHRLGGSWRSRRVRSLGRSIQTAARASTIAMARPCWQVGARFSGQTSRSTPPSRPTFTREARLGVFNRPNQAIRPVPAGAGGADLRSLLGFARCCESSRSHVFGGRRRPGQPCRESSGLRRAPSARIEEKVAAILCATRIRFLPRRLTPILGPLGRHSAPADPRADHLLASSRWAGRRDRAASSFRQRVSCRQSRPHLPLPRLYGKAGMARAGRAKALGHGLKRTSGRLLAALVLALACACALGQPEVSLIHDPLR